MDAIRGAHVRMGVDPLGGAGVHYWPAIAERYKLDLTVVNRAGRPDLSFHDGRLGWPDSHGPVFILRHARLIGLKDRFDIAFACDTDHDRHGIVTRSAGLLPPNHYLVGGDRLSVPASAGMAQGRGRRKNGGEQPDDRSRQRQAEAQAV